MCSSTGSASAENAPVFENPAVPVLYFEQPMQILLPLLVGPATFSAGDLPPGLTINPTTGTISGTPELLPEEAVCQIVSPQSLLRMPSALRRSLWPLH